MIAAELEQAREKVPGMQAEIDAELEVSVREVRCDPETAAVLQADSRRC